MGIRANFPWPVLDPVVTQQCSRQGAHLHPIFEGFVPSFAGVGNPPFVASAMETSLSTDAAHHPLPSQLPARPPGTMATEPGSVPLISAARTRATEPGGMDWSVNRLPALDTPSAQRGKASRNLQSSHPQPLTYANVAASSSPAVASPSSSPSSSPSPLKPSETTRHNRTQILRRLPFNTTTRQIITDLTRQLGYAEDALFERVLRDPRDSRRFYLTYRTDELRQYATRKGFYVGSLHIKPTDGSTNGYIPFPPYYIDEGTLRELLTPYGIIVTGGFVETALHTRIAGYKFAIRFHKDAIPPKSVTYNGCTMDIKYDDDLRHCKYCGRYGHLIGKCRTKAADDLHHKQRRDELRVNQYRTARHQLEVDCDTETAKLDDNYEARLTALADAYQAALIAIEGSDGCSERAHHLAEVLAEDKATMQEEHMDTQEYYSNLMLDQIAALDERFRREGGVVPPDMLGTPTESHDSAMDTMGVSEDDLLTRAVCRMNSGIMGHSPYRIAEPAVEFPPKSVPEAESSPALPVVEVVPAESPPTVIPSTADPPSGPRPVVPLIDPALVEAQTARLSADFNYLTWNKNIIQLQTDTPNITRIVRSHLFRLQVKEGYGHVNPMETMVCTSTTDSTCRLIYLRDDPLTHHMKSFLDYCRHNELINFMGGLNIRPNPEYDSNTDWG